LSVASLTGTPIAGALIQRENGGYTYAILFDAGALALGAVLAFAARTAKVGIQLKQKV